MALSRYNYDAEEERIRDFEKSKNIYFLQIFTPLHTHLASIPDHASMWLLRLVISKIKSSTPWILVVV